MDVSGYSALDTKYGYYNFKGGHSPGHAGRYFSIHLSDTTDSSCWQSRNSDALNENRTMSIFIL